MDARKRRRTVGRAAGSVQVSKNLLTLRRQFKARLLQNPNFFGNLKDSPFKAKVQLIGNTTYEEVGCVGFQPQLNRLEAVVRISQPSGYGGDVCSAGSTEYVRFYVSSDGGATWEDQGLTEFTVYDIPQGTAGSRRLEYAVALEVAPRSRPCWKQETLLVRAILSWNFEPPEDQPGFRPVWGDVHDAHILANPYRLNLPIADLLDVMQIQLTPQLVQLVDLNQQVALAKPRKLGVAELAKTYQGKVETHRFALPHVHKLLQTSLSLEQIGAVPAALFGGVVGLDFADLVEKLQPTDGNTSYEELECVGLDNARDELVAVIRIKKPIGYSGDPCSDGSTEYVTFWGDFDGNGTFETCLGTAQVQVYDISKIPEQGLEYSLQLPVNLHPYRRPCGQGPRIVPIRAILSWQVPPPCSNPNYVPVWGNREQALVHLRQGTAVQPGDYTPYLYSLCNRDVCSISDETGYATGDRPFGGVINIQGEIPAALALGTADTLKYKVSVRPLHDDGTEKGSGPWQPLVNDFKVQVQVQEGPGSVATSRPLLQEIDSDGYYTYREYGTPPGRWRRVISPHRQLAQWYTNASQTGLWEIKIEAKDGNGIIVAGRTICAVDGSDRQTVRVKLDQTPPVAGIWITGFFPRGGKTKKEAVDCATFQVGDVICGEYVATDPDGHFDRLSLDVQPADAANRAKPCLDLEHGSHDQKDGCTSPTSYPTLDTYGVNKGEWKLDTEGMAACGFTVRLHVSDRTIHSCSNRRSAEDFVGFCLKAPTP